MKLILEIELDVADSLKEHSEAELQQLIFDTYIQYVTVQHYLDAFYWGSKAKIGTTEEDLPAKMISEFHTTWGDIAEKAKWSLKT